MNSESPHRPTPPVMRVAPLGELKVYTIYEHELDDLARGRPSSLYLNFAILFLPIFVTLLVTLTTTTIASDRSFIAYVCVCVISLIAGVVLLALWVKSHRSSKSIVERIRNRMPPPEGIQEPDPGE